MLAPEQVRSGTVWNRRYRLQIVRDSIRKGGYSRIMWPSKLRSSKPQSVGDDIVRASVGDPPRWEARTSPPLRIDAENREQTLNMLDLMYLVPALGRSGREEGGHKGRIDANPTQHAQRLRKPYPPDIAPTIQYGSLPEATSSGNDVSGDSWERSCSQAKNRTIGRRSCV